MVKKEEKKAKKVEKITKTPKKEKYLDISVVAQRLNVSVQHLYRMRDRNEIEMLNFGARLYKISETEVEAFIERRRTMFQNGV